MKRFLRRVLPVLVVLTLVLMVTPRPARADSVVTDCGSDTQLSQLLPAGGNIHFQCGCNPTTPIVLTSTKVINTDTALDGGCSGFALSGNNVRRLFYVNPGKKLYLTNISLINGNAGSDYGGAVYVNAGTLELHNVWMKHNVTNGYAGGAIVSPNGNLLIEGAVFENNSASSGAAISATGYVNITWSTFTNNTATQAGGAALSVAGIVTVDRSAFSNNKSPNGYGAIYNNGDLSIQRSTISSNTALTNGGGIFNLDTLNLENVTLSGNTADTGGGIYNRGNATLVNVTIANNSAPAGGGIYHYASAGGKTIALKNTLFAHGGTGTNCRVDVSSPTNITSQGYNLSDDTSCAAYLNQTGDWNNLDAKLGPLQNNGHYYLLTHLPLTGSPAIDRGTSSGAPTIDQQDVTRPQGTAFDIGAMEVCAAKPDKPVLYRPANNTKVKGTRVELVRGYAKCGDNYRVTVKDAATNQTVFSKKNIHDYTVKTTALTKGKTYKWFAQACNSIGCTKSDTWKFTVK